MMLGVGLALFAGSLVGMQNIFNSKVEETAGSWTTTTWVLGMGFIASLFFGLLFEGTGLFQLNNLLPWHAMSGVIGIGVVTGLVQGIKRLGPTYAISIVLTSQLVFALLFDSLGWLGLQQVPFTLMKLLGVLLIIGGIFVFKMTGSATPSPSAASLVYQMEK